MFLFLDESGDHGLVNVDPQFPVFVLCGILVSDTAYEAIDRDVRELKKKFWGEKKVILHSRDIRKCENEFQILFDGDLKKAFYTEINKLVSESAYTIIASAINKENHIKQYGKLASDVYEISLSFIIERSVFFLDDLQSGNRQLRIVIERRGKREDGRLQEHFQRLCSRGTGYVTPDRIRSYGMDIEFRSKSDDVNGLQLADLVAYPMARYVLDPKRANPAFEVLEPKIYEKSGRRYGLKVFP
ncbi:MAG: DUF3800 domain-containing protein [Ignavibacteriales bacterium]|nr:DUF3800 domain-containing protein [Ignavibacteriales bacterium]